MLDGKRYTRTNNGFATDYFWPTTAQRLRGALSAVKQHVEYYKEVRGATLQGIIDIYEKYLPYVEYDDVNLYPDEIRQPERYSEGLKKQITANVFERDPRARQECIAHYGVSCMACGFNFREVYGDIGAGFIHVHHLTQLSTIREGYQVDSIKEMRPVCPNCHAMLHSETPPLTIEKLKSTMARD